MSLNDIKLSPALLSNLYPDQLIEDVSGVSGVSEVSGVSGVQEVQKVQEVSGLKVKGTDALQDKIKSEFRSLGNNRQQILIIVDYGESPFLPDTELALLTNMLGACKLSMDDVAIINLHHYNNKSGKEIIAHFKSKRILMFGVSPTDLDLPVNFPQYQVQNLASSSFLYSPTLDIIGSDKLQKSKLWVCLQRLFNIS